MSYILQISTTAMRLIDPDGRELAYQAGFACRENGAWVFGGADSYFHNDASGACCNAYLSRCDSEGVIERGDWQGSAADLVYEQLSKMVADGGVEGGSAWLLVSSAYSAEQLAVLAGVVEALFKLDGIIPMPLACSCGLRAGHYKILEAEMHQLMVSDVVVDGVARSIEKTQSFPEWSLQGIYNHLYDAVCDRFVAEQRYDPRHATANKEPLLTQLAATPPGNDFALSVGTHKLTIKHSELALTLPDEIAPDSDRRECRLLDFGGAPLWEGMFESIGMLGDPGAAEVLSQVSLPEPADEGVAIFKRLG